MPLQQHEDDMAIEVAGDHIVLTPATQDFQDAWEAYKEIEPRYHNANRKFSTETLDKPLTI